MAKKLFDPPEREETIGFTEEEEISWHEYFLDFREKVWPMFEAQGFTFVEAITFWRNEIHLYELKCIRQLLEEQSGKEDF